MRSKKIFLILVLLIGFFLILGYLPAQDDDNDDNDNNGTDVDYGENKANIGFGLALMPYLSYSSQLLPKSPTTYFAENGVPSSKLLLQIISPGYNIGFDVEYPLGSFLSLGGGIRYDFNAYGWYEWKLNNKPAYILTESINIPLYLKLRNYQKYWMPFAIAGIDVGYIINILSWYPEFENDEGIQESGIREFGDEDMSMFRIGLVLGGGVSIDIGVLTIDIKILYSIGLNNEIKDIDNLKAFGGESTRNILSLSFGWRFMIGDRRKYMPYGFHSPIDVLNIPPDINVNKSFIEKLTLDKTIENSVDIINYDEINVYLKNLRLRVLDSYGNNVINEPFSSSNERLPFFINDDTNFRSFEEYTVFIEASFIDDVVKKSNEVTFETGLIYKIDEFGYKTISSSSFEYNDDGSLTEDTIAKVEKIVNFIKDVSTEKTISDLNVGIEGTLDDSVTQAKVNHIQKLLNELSIKDYVEDLFVFIDISGNNDTVPNLIKFDMQFSS